MIAMRPFLLSVLTLLALTACDKTDQIDRPGTWKLPPAGQGANDANLRAMIANPNDLIAGQDSPGTQAAEVVPPIDLLYAGRRRILPAVSTTGGGGGSADQRPFGGSLGGGMAAGGIANTGGSSGTGGGGGGAGGPGGGGL